MNLLYICTPADIQFNVVAFATACHTTLNDCIKAFIMMSGTGYTSLNGILNNKNTFYIESTFQGTQRRFI